jgi:gliding motility-associated-like protein
MRNTTVLILALASTALPAQLVVDNTITVQQLVEDVLLGGGVTVSNITFNGQPASQTNIQIGSFNGSACNVGLPEGLTLSSGDIGIALGPNTESGFTLPAGGIGGPNDADLDQASSSTTFDRAVLEFDFVPAGDSLLFNYVFGSEEYLEWVSAGFNDVFGFFLSGPGISGPYSNNAMNIALVPGTAQPVSIDNVNNIANPSYYVDNGDGFTAPFNSDPQYIQFDGFTVPLTARALVQCGQPYHIKIAIADAGDPILDSSVFLEGGSFSSPNAVELELVTASADGTLTEGCSDATFTISRPGDQLDLEITVLVGGSAANGTDYTQIPTVITIPAGQNSVTYPVEAFEDNTAEGDEEIVLTAVYVNACGDTSTSSASVIVREYVPIVITTQDLFLQCDVDSALVSAQANGGFGDLAYLWNFGGSAPSFWAAGLVNGTYTLTVTDDCEKAANASVTVNSGCEIEVPNVFSPNGDGQNDRFTIEGILGTTNTVRIYNRWGQVVFEANNYKNTWAANGISDGTYFYEVKVNSSPEPYTGHVTILSTDRRR